MDIRKTGELLYRLRKEKGMTQKQVAEAMGVSIHAVKGVEEKRYRTA